ncbi:MAG: hypothetical protein ETSY1_40900 [Candidatus Entotheonella factor]|uniref:Toxin n=1 Tax=Entotheonella factor TaxID=1429438 RepID=W4L6T1_ENTF1|nr:MAG: hypothetical protein ETSY1_40900 [Candidatus Entotheonella factor]
MTFRLTADAQDDIERIYWDSYDTFGERQADIYHQGLVDCFEMLDDHPYIGRDYSEVRQGLRRYEYESHSVYYRVTDTGPLILRILHRRQDPARHL